MIELIQLFSSRLPTPKEGRMGMEMNDGRWDECGDPEQKDMGDIQKQKERKKSRSRVRRERLCFEGGVDSNGWESCLMEKEMDVKQEKWKMSAW